MSEPRPRSPRITVTYGTGAENLSAQELREHLHIPAADFEALGLHKPTVFKLDPPNRKRLPWAKEYFVPQEYVRSRNIIAGTLNATQQRIVEAIFRARHWEFPLP